MGTPAPTQAQPPTKLKVAGSVYVWAECLLVTSMVISQFLGVISSSVDTIQKVTIGNDPLLGPYKTGKTNDVPFSDRVLVCVAKDDSYIPIQLSDLLSSTKASVLEDDANGAAKAGFRVIERQGLILDSATYNSYAQVCQLASTTLEGIFYTCQELGYDVVKDGLRIVHGADSNITILLQGVLPLLILPFSDNAPGARYALPGWDGSACIVRLTGKYVASTSTVARVGGLERAPRESKTTEWLRRPGGKWRHGWYEDLEGDRWYSFMSNAGAGSKYLPPIRSFDGETHEELVCLGPVACNQDIQRMVWGPRFTVTHTTLRATSIVVYNASQYGMFWYDGVLRVTYSSKYDWQMAVSNASIVVLICRWIIAIMVLHRSFYNGKCKLHNIGVGALSNLSTFLYLPILLLPRLSTILSAFFTIGCDFQGGQTAFSDTWFVMYPSIIEVTLVYYSIINTLAKVTRRRVTDALFTPTVLTLSLIHYLRAGISKHPWFDVPEGHIQTQVSSDEMIHLQLHQFFTTDIALRLNGGMTKLLIMKLSLMAVSLVPMLLAKTLPAHNNVSKSLAGVEKALAVRVCNIGGLGQWWTYEVFRCNTPPTSCLNRVYFGSNAAQIYPASGEVALSSYELARLGYVVFGGKYLIHLDDWDRISMLAGLRSFYHLWNYRVVVFKVSAANKRSKFLQVEANPVLMRVDEIELLRIKIWDISVHALSVRAEAMNCVSVTTTLPDLH